MSPLDTISLWSATLCHVSHTFPADFADEGKLSFTEKHIETLVSHTFFVDSHYTPFTSPEDNHDAFVRLSLWARTCGEIDRESMLDGMTAVNKVSLMSAKSVASPSQPATRNTTTPLLFVSRRKSCA